MGKILQSELFNDVRSNNDTHHGGASV